MNSDDKLNSTEKLLDTIRGGRTDTRSEETSFVPKVSRPPLPIKRRVKKRLTAGVFIDFAHISLVLTGDCGSGDARELVKWAYVPIPAMVERSDTRFVSFLRSTMDDFLSEHGKVDVWSCIDSKDLKLRNILLPDLPASKLANAAFWGLKKEVDFDRDQEIFDFHILGPVQSSGVTKQNAIVFSGLKTEIKALKQLFSSAGYPLAGITAAPFFIQNFIQSGLAGKGDGLEVIVKVARYYTEITCFHRSTLQFVRTIRTGSHSLVEDLVDPSSDDPALKSGDIPAILSQASDPDTGFFAAMVPGVERLVGKVMRTGDYCSNNYGANDPVQQYLFFGETDNCKPFNDYARKQTSTDVALLNPYEQFPHLTHGAKVPRGGSERCGIISALGLALSTPEGTPDFLNTYIQRNARAKFKRMNLIISGLCLSLLLVFSGFWWWQDQVLQRAVADKNQILAQVDKYIPQVNKALLDQTLKQAGERVTKVNTYAADLLPLAVINELCSITPDAITLLSFEADLKPTLAEDKQDKKAAGKEEKKARRSVLLKGVVAADYTSLEATLTDYVVRLGDSSIFGEIMLLNKTIETNGEKRVLNFTADMEIL